MRTEISRSAKVITLDMFDLRILTSLNETVSASTHAVFCFDYILRT